MEESRCNTSWCERESLPFTDVPVCESHLSDPSEWLLSAFTRLSRSEQGNESHQTLGFVLGTFHGVACKVRPERNICEALLGAELSWPTGNLVGRLSLTACAAYTAELVRWNCSAELAADHLQRVAWLPSALDHSSLGEEGFLAAYAQIVDGRLAEGAEMRSELDGTRASVLESAADAVSLLRSAFAPVTLDEVKPHSGESSDDSGPSLVSDRHSVGDKREGFRGAIRKWKLRRTIGRIGPLGVRVGDVITVRVEGFQSDLHGVVQGFGADSITVGDMTVPANRVLGVLKHGSLIDPI